MNYKQANSVKHLAPGVMKVLKGLEIECPECGGNGQPIGMVEGPSVLDVAEYGDEILRSIPVKCKKCNSTGKILYSHTPQVGEWCLYEGKPHIIVSIDAKKNDIWLSSNEVHYIFTLDRRKKLIPILPWEEIEEVLEKAGYICNIYTEHWQNGKVKEYQFHCFQPGGYGHTIKAKSRLPAVYQAVLELGENK